MVGMGGVGAGMYLVGSPWLLEFEVEAEGLEMRSRVCVDDLEMDIFEARGGNMI
jgi:hypothetical protein